MDHPAILLERTPFAPDAATLREARAADPSGADYLDAVALDRIAYRSDGLDLQAWLARPRAGGPHPCVIYNRGGTYADPMAPAEALATLALIANWGYAVVSSQYRGTFASPESAGAPGSAGRGDEFGGRDIADVLGLFPLLDELPEADAGRIAMWGWSRGGLMTYLALAAQSPFASRIASAIVVAGVSDAFDYMARRPDMEREVFSVQIPDYWANREAALAARSPIRWAEALHPGAPLLLLHAAGDARVPPDQTLRMARRLHELGRAFRLVFFEGGDHALSSHRAEYLALCRAWLGATLP